MRNRAKHGRSEPRTRTVALQRETRSGIQTHLPLKIEELQRRVFELPQRELSQCTSLSQRTNRELKTFQNSGDFTGFEPICDKNSECNDSV